MDTPGTPDEPEAPEPEPAPGVPPSAPPLPPAPSETAGPPRRRRGAIALGAAIVVVLALVAVGFAVSRGTGGTSTPVAAPKLLPPSGGRAEAQPFRVTLAWTAPSGGAPVAGYSVSRDGVRLAQVTTTSYTDTRVAPGQSYQYTVQSVGHAPASATSSPLTIEARTAKPPLSRARLTGTFEVKMKILSSAGNSAKVGSAYREGWKFVPTCSSGPCSVTMHDLVKAFRGLHGKLKRNGVTYRGSVTGFHGVYCGSKTVHMTSTLTITLRLTRATGEVGTWNASGFTATVSESIPASAGCVSGHIGYRVSGHRVG